MSYEGRLGIGYSASLPNDAFYLASRKGAKKDKAIIALHGAGNVAASTWLPYHNQNFAGCLTNLFGTHTDYGFLAIDDAGAQTWGDDAAMGRIDDALTFLTSQGYNASKVGLVGWSMGGINALNWIKRNPSKVACACLFAPLVDLDYAHTTIDPVNVDAAYGGNYAANAPGHKVADERATFRNICPIQIYHAINDAVLPIQQSRDFVAGVADSRIQLAEVDTGAAAGHYAVFVPVSLPDVMSFFRSNL